MTYIYDKISYDISNEVKEGLTVYRAWWNSRHLRPPCS